MSEHNIEINPLTDEDAKAFYGKHPPKSIMAWSIRLNGEIAAISGVTVGRSSSEFFSDIKDGVDVPDITKWRVSKAIVRLVAEKGFSPIATTAASDKYLLKLGFSYLGEYKNHGVYKL